VIPHPHLQEDLRKELAAANDRMFGLQADLELAVAAKGSATTTPAAEADVGGEGGHEGAPGRHAAV